MLIALIWSLHFAYKYQIIPLYFINSYHYYVSKTKRYCEPEDKSIEIIQLKEEKDKKVE